MTEYTIEYGNNEQFEELLKIVKDGDRVTYLGASGSESPEKINLTMVWNDSIDRPQEHNIKTIIIRLKESPYQILMTSYYSYGLVTSVYNPVWHGELPENIIEENERGWIKMIDEWKERRDYVNKMMTNIVCKIKK